MSAKHTPGPWLLGNENNHCADVVAGPVSIGLDRINPHTGSEGVISREEMLANVHLVMAAPELLATVKHARDALNVAAHTLDLREIDRVVRAARAACDAAIAKAEVTP